MHPKEYKKFVAKDSRQPVDRELSEHPEDPTKASWYSARGPRIDPRAFGLLKVAYSVNETLDVLSIGRTSLYKLVNSGGLKPAKLGKKTLFYAADIAALLVKLQETA